VKTHDYSHHYRGYWSDGGKCRIRIYRTHGDKPVVICSQLPENKNTSVTNMAEYLAAEVIEKHGLPTPLSWIEHYPKHERRIGEYSLARFSSWERREVSLGGVWRCRVGSPRWSPLRSEEVDVLINRASEQPMALSTTKSRLSASKLPAHRGPLAAFCHFKRLLGVLETLLRCSLLAIHRVAYLHYHDPEHLKLCTVSRLLVYAYLPAHCRITGLRRPYWAEGLLNLRSP
jgi:hypothetical protein